jgi:outer membrane murein-binding lipoprotein Lpp
MKLLHRKALYLFAVLISLALINGCGSGKDKTNDSDDIITLDSLAIDEQLIQDVKAVKEIFYSLPSPLETAMILKQSGAEYNEELLNPTDNTSKYVTNKSMALNLGIYTTDLSYASLFDQTQATINYMNASKKMAEGLGILNAIDENIIERLEANINNRDVIMDIISETIMNSSAFFEENDRQAMSTIVLVGGWVEGLYIATNLVGADVDFNNNEMIRRIIDQKLTLSTVLSLLDENSDNEDVQNVMTNVEELKAIFEKIDITSSKIEPVTDEETNVTTLKSETTISMSVATYNELKEKVQVIRSNYIL